MSRHLRHAAAATAVALISLLCAGTPAALARDVNVRSFDGVTIFAHFNPATKRAPNERVPTVLVGPGYPTRGDTNFDGNTSDNIGQANLRAEGYNVLTWDPRGIGNSGGIVTFDSPEFEARDVQALIDWVATQPEALVDSPNDPRVGMSGSSYGGAIQLATAAIDGRLDAIIPDVTWNNLGTGFFPEGSMKTSFSVLICGNGNATGIVPGNLLGPAAAVLERSESHLKSACVESIGGSVNPANRQWFIDRTPPGLRERITTPTLITQGTVDTLFGLSEAVSNHDVLRSKGIPVKMMWFCGGHGQCTTSQGEEGHVRRAGLAWLNRYLKRDEAADTGAGFEWLADDGVWRSGPDYPLGDAGTIDASGSSFPSLGLSPLASTQSGTDGFAATPAPSAVSVTFSAPPAGSDIVGAPKVKITYKGNTLSPNTYLFAQIVDGRANRVIGSQVTPIPVVLDDRVRTVERELEPIAARGGTSSEFRLQITAGTGVFGPQRSVGGVILRAVSASLPLVDATRSTRGGGAALRTPGRPNVRLSTKRVDGRTRVVLRTRLRGKPCTGSFTFKIGPAGRKKATYTARVSSSCTVKKTVRVRFKPGTQIRVSAKFNGNSELKARSARTVSFRTK